jgi:hypothetical protein
MLLLVGCGGLGGGLGGGAKGTIAVANGNLIFGSVAIGSSTTLTDTISNNTSSSVTINSITGQSSGFLVTGVTLPFVLAAGQASSFGIQFHPAATGTPSATIAFEDQNSQTIVSLVVSGEAVEAGNLSLSPASIAFGNVAVGSSQSSTVTLSNNGASDLNVNQITLSGAGFVMSNLTLPLTLHPADSTSATITFVPPAAGNFSGSITFLTTSDQVNGTVVLNLSGTGVAVSPGTLASNPVTLAFGSIQVGSSSNLSETLTNTGGSPVTISQANLTGAAFSINGLSLPLTLTANGTVTFTATFMPSSAGAAGGSLSIVSDASNSPLNIAFSGTGASAGQLAVSPTNLSFGNVVVGSSSSLSGNLAASGAPVTVTSATLNNDEFVLSEIALPTTIPAGQSASFSVTFKPQASGASSASLSFSSSASNSPAVQSMTGTGMPALQHTVDLAWTASVDAVGYNIYRSSVSGGPYSLLNSALDSATAYTDNTVVSGQTYYYVATAVDSDSNESGYSTQVQAVIPNP